MEATHIIKGRFGLPASKAPAMTWMSSKHQFQVVGWGFDRSDSVSSVLQLTSMPQVPDTTCISYQPIFYSRVLNGKKFCAGSRNGLRIGTYYIYFNN